MRMIYFKPMARQVLLFIFCWVSFQGLFAQSTISGKVTSSEDSQPIPGVNILIKGTSNGTTTNFDGEFKLSANPGETLIFSYIGYINQEIEISSQTQLDIVLEPDMQQLEEVVVVGYGTQKKADLTGSVSSISGDEISKMSSPRIEQALMGKTAGVQISAVDASPGAGLSIKIRGDNSINANNEPLVVIDGFIGGDLRSLNTNDVESIEVLKDASATAIYGSRGSNGVIIVTTKSGKSGKTEVSLTAEYGFQKLNKKLDLMNGTEYWALRRLNSADLDPTAWEVTNIDTLGAGTDWQDEIIQDAPIKRYNARITGGNEKTRYAAFIDYIDQAGIVKNSDYSKGSVRLNLDHDISDKARFGARISYYKSTENGARINGNYGSRGGPITLNATIFPSIIPVYAEDGSYNPLFDSSSQRDNPVHTADKTIDETFRNYLQGSGFFEYDIIDGLTYKLNMGYLFQTREQRRYVSKTLQAALNEGSADLDNVYSNRWLIENTLNYRKSFNDHDLNILAGFTSQVDNTNRNDISTTGFATEVLNLNDIGLAENVVNKGSSYSQVNQASFLGRINYGYKGKYLVTLTGRSDGSSVFAKNNKWAFFPSASFGWRISEESFMNTSNTFSNLKLRLSYGKSGNQAISPYQSLASYNTGVIYTIDGSTQLTNGVVPGRISNADLRWETTAQTNVGLDMGFLQDRLGFTVDVYRKLTNDLLYNARLAPNSGFSSQLQNIGEVENRGVELSVNAQVVKSGDFTFDVSGNISFVDNKVLSLGEDSVVYLNTSGGSMGSGYSTTGVLEIGQPMGNFFGYVFDGIYQNEQEVAALPFPGAIPGAAKYRDINGDGEINEDDRTTIGNALPNVYYGFTTNFAYKGLDLNIVFQGVKGAEMAYLGKVNLLRPGSQNNGFKEVQDYWTPENGSNTMVGIGETWDEMSSRFVESADFLRVRNISLGYTLPKTVSQKIGAKNLRVYANAINWFTFTNYSGFDPEVNSRHNGSDFQQNVQRGVDNGGYPSAKQFLMGINLTF